ncbi:DUF421 domain-containing protein [Pseudomonas sp. PS02288]|uniref:DUF421 domain-containing protein n=1 Tax=Pseudomonas sp. PS02288 TaxID=2991443 RepID=UPI00249CCFA7|nr:DUF421 domain-containing protein [Pseudomonas sp. PS02288]
MEAFDLKRMLLDEFPVLFLGEVALRASFAYLAVFAFLKISGRRGVRQLSLFEVVVILTLGSAAGDVSFYDDVPLLPIVMVFITLLVLYRATTYAMERSPRFGAWMEGKPMVIIRDGQYDLPTLEATNISDDEFLMELRQQGVEHLGQVRLGILEVNGDVSLYFFDSDETRHGLSVLPPSERVVVETAHQNGLHACCRCGFVQSLDYGQGGPCPRCERTRWSMASDRPRAR